MAVSSTGRWIAAGTRDGRIVICVSEVGATCRTIDAQTGELNDLQFSPDERLLAIANDNIRLMALNESNGSFFLREDKRKYGTVRFDRTGSELLTINSQSEIELIAVRSHAALTRFCCSSFYGEVALFGDDTRIANAGHWPRIWTRSGKLVTTLAGDREYETFRPIAVDEKRRTIFMGCQDGRVYAWSLVNFTLLKRSPPQPDYVDTIALVPKPHILAYCSFGKTLHVWSAAGDRNPEILNARSSSNIVSLPDGVSILFGTNSGTVQIWNLADPFPHLVSERPFVQ